MVDQQEGETAPAETVQENSTPPEKVNNVNARPLAGISDYEVAQNGGPRSADPVQGNSSSEQEPSEQSRQTTTNNSKMQSLEIDVGDGKQQNGNETDESFEDNESDMEHLLGDAKTTTKKSSPQARNRCCTRPTRVGNMVVFLPSVFARTGWGIAGPHWFGPFCVLFLLGLASNYFIGISWRRIGPITTTFCVLFAAVSTYNLFNVAYRDPGVVKLQSGEQRPQDTQDDQRLQFRWCDRCQIFQPVDGAHCSDCNVCVAGFDHHCVWMGTCIGKKNFKQFVAFNITWLLYLIFSIMWVSVLGPLIFGRHHSQHTGSDNLANHTDGT